MTTIFQFKFKLMQHMLIHYKPKYFLRSHYEQEYVYNCQQEQCCSSRRQEQLLLASRVLENVAVVQ